MNIYKPLANLLCECCNSEFKISSLGYDARILWYFHEKSIWLISYTEITNLQWINNILFEYQLLDRFCFQISKKYFKIKPSTNKKPWKWSIHFSKNDQFISRKQRNLCTSSMPNLEAFVNNSIISIEYS